MTITLDGTKGTTTPGLYSNSTFTGTYADGIVVDYTTGTGRISVGSSDGLTIYNGGVASTTLLAIDSSGNVTLGGSVAGQKLNVKGIVAFEAISGSTNNWLNYTYTDNTLRWNYNGSGSDELILNSNGVLSLLGAATTANGVGICFPETQSASSNANTLDDYEEGTWTGGFGGKTATGTWTSVSGTYTKIGRQVIITGAISGTSMAFANAVSYSYINGLPFSAAVVCSGNTVTGSISATGFSCAAYVSGNQVILYAANTTSAVNDIEFSVSFTV